MINLSPFKWKNVTGSSPTQEYPPATIGRFTSVLSIDMADMTHTTKLMIDNVAEADNGKTFTLMAENVFGSTNYTVTINNIVTAPTTAPPTHPPLCKLCGKLANLILTEEYIKC